MQVAYAIGKAQPVGFYVDCFGTETVPVGTIQKAVLEVFDPLPAAIIRDLDLLRLIYAKTAAYGHFGRELPEFTWERTDRVDALKRPPASDPTRRVVVSGGFVPRLRPPAAGRRRRLEEPCRVDGSEYDEAGQLARCPRSRVPGRARPGRRGEEGRRAQAGRPRVGRTPSPGSWSTSRWPTSTAPSTTWCRRWPPTPSRGQVKVRFAGQDVDGFVLERVEESSHEGRLAPLRRAVSPEPVLSPAIAHLSASVAARYAGTRSDVLRLAVPTRHATVEKEPSPRAPRTSVDVGAAAAAWRGTPAARRSCGTWPTAASRGRWAAAPGEDWPDALARAAAATYASGRGALLCVPDHRDVARVDAALTAVLGEGTTSCSPPTSAWLSATGRSCASCAARCGSSSAPAPPSRRSTTSAWSRSGTTATTCTPTSTRPTHAHP